MVLLHTYAVLLPLDSWFFLLRGEYFPSFLFHDWIIDRHYGGRQGGVDDDISFFDLEPRKLQW